MSRMGLVITASALALSLAGCGNPTLPVSSEVPPGTTAPSSIPAGSLVGPTPSEYGTPSASPTPEAIMPDFMLTSTAFAAGGSIPRRFSCDGDDVSPDLAWAGAPAGTAALVLVVDDPDARGFAHWLVLDIFGSRSGALPLGVSVSPDAPAQGTNDFGRIGWGGPCPPTGEHRYTFTLYALGAPLGIAGAPRASDVRAALDRVHVLGMAVLSARYRRGG